MNKLEEYRDYWAKFQDNYSKDWPHSESFIEGFNHALELDLPVKFHEWCVRSNYEYKDVVRKFFEDKELAKKLYQYWIDNVYKPE